VELLAARKRRKMIIAHGTYKERNMDSGPPPLDITSNGRANRIKVRQNRKI